MTKRIQIAFVDDTCLHASGEKFEEKMQQIMDQYTKLHEAIGGKTQQEKIMFLCWAWCYCNVEKTMKQVETELVVHEDKTRCIQTKRSTRMLGVHLAPALEWKGKI